MIAVLTGDIVGSSQVKNKTIWLKQLRAGLRVGKERVGNKQIRQEIYWGDSFQVEVMRSEYALWYALLLRAGIRMVETETKHRLDIRIAIGLGEVTYQSNKVAESDGEAYQNSGRKFDLVKDKGGWIVLKTPFPQLDKEMKVSFGLANAVMKDWSAASA